MECLTTLTMVHLSMTYLSRTVGEQLFVMEVEVGNTIPILTLSTDLMKNPLVFLSLFTAHTCGI